MTPTPSSPWWHRLHGTLNRIFGAVALMIGITFTGRVLAALVRGLSIRQVWPAGLLGLALIVVGIIYVRPVPTKR